MRTLQALRQAAGLTERQLANKMLVRPERVAAWERGLRMPAGQEVALFALAVGVTPASVPTAVNPLVATGGD
jgi:transcriptional regulator with XRE-family HTH domain